MHLARTRARAARWIALASPALAACGILSPGPRARLSVGLDARGAYADPALFRAEITQGRSRRLVQGSDLDVRARTAETVAAGLEHLPLRVGDPVSVRVALVRAPGDTAAAGTVTWTPEADVGYGVGAVAGSGRPQGFCFSISHAIPLPARDGTRGDTLFITHSALPRGAVC